MTFIHKLSVALTRRQSSFAFFGNQLKYFNSTQDKAQQNYDFSKHLAEVIEPAPDLLLRGSVGTKELEHAMRRGILGAPHSNRREAHFDIAEYVRENNSGVLYSATECHKTATAYANLSFIPKNGTIFVLGMPAVFTNPRKQLLVNPDMFTQYQERLLNSHEPDIKLQCIKNMTINNSEITIVTGSGKNDNWHPRLDRDVAKVIIIQTPGIVGHYLNYQPSLFEVVNNADFAKRGFSLEIYFPGNISSEEMNENAYKQGIIQPDQRLLTLNDAIVVNNSIELESLQYNDSSITQIVSSVPANIPEGDRELIPYLAENIKSTIDKSCRIAPSLISP
jgi:hypothetical protein